VILDEPRVDAEELEQRTGWELKTEGLCRGETCIPLPAGAGEGGALDARVVSDRLGLPLLHDEAHDVWCLGPSPASRALDSAQVPPIVLPDRDGRPFELASLRGRKVLLVAWASW
jgi:hypothetical protein